MTSRSSDNPVRTVALAGNPNVGKSTLFNLLTGMRQHTGNWTGKTVGLAVGEYKREDVHLRFVDLPGTYSLNSRSEEERISKEYISSGEAELVVIICDATCLERNLILALQILELTQNVIICINLMDEARKKGISVSIEVLERELSVPVIPICARSGEGVDKVIELVNSYTIKEAARKTDGEPIDAVRRAEEIGRASVKNENKDPMKRDRAIDKILTSKVFGFPIMLLLLALVFWITIEGANIPSAILLEILFNIQDILLSICENLRIPWWISDPLILGAYRTAA